VNVLRSDLDLAGLAKEFETLSGWTNFVGAFVPDHPDIYCWDCGVERSTWFIDGDTYCDEHFGVRIVRMIEEARQEAAVQQELVNTAATLADRARAEGLEVTNLGEPSRLDPRPNCPCHHQTYVYNIEGARYCLNGAIAILREVLG
jgi:hypothetical protein